MDKWSALKFCLMSFALKLHWLTVCKSISLKGYRQLNYPELQCHVKWLDLVGSTQLNSIFSELENTKQRDASDRCSPGVFTSVWHVANSRNSRQYFFFPIQTWIGIGSLIDKTELTACEESVDITDPSCVRAQEAQTTLRGRRRLQCASWEPGPDPSTVDSESLVSEWYSLWCPPILNNSPNTFFSFEYL